MWTMAHLFLEDLNHQANLTTQTDKPQNEVPLEQTQGLRENE